MADSVSSIHLRDGVLRPDPSPKLALLFSCGAGGKMVSRTLKNLTLTFETCRQQVHVIVN
jgi:hypothetical protein